MKAFKKALMACMAVGALSAVVATSAFAATVSDDKTKVSAGTSMADKSGQMTVLVIAKGADNDGIQAEDILYIDQQAAAEGIFQNMGVKGGALADGDYVLKIGGENLDEIIVEEFKVGGASRVIQLGDCDGIDGIDSGDLVAVLNHMFERSVLTGDALIAADCDGITGIDSGDLVAILNHMFERSTLGTVTVTD